MIGILKSDEPPKNLITKGQAKTETDCLAYDECPDDYISGVRGFAKTETDRRRQGAIYGSKPVKRILVAAHSCKCCYCERKYDEPRHLAVEHFRPKTAVRQSNKHKEQYPGYYWLAYDWDNLLLSCHECNSDWKGIFSRWLILVHVLFLTMMITGLNDPY